MTSSVALVWFRRDLRLSDHPPLAAAAKEGLVVPVYLYDPEGEAGWPEGGRAARGSHPICGSAKSASGRHGLRRTAGGATFLRQLGWREFGYHLLHHFPDTARQPLRPEFGRFP